MVHERPTNELWCKAGTCWYYDSWTHYYMNNSSNTSWMKVCMSHSCHFKLNWSQRRHCILLGIATTKLFHDLLGLGPEEDDDGIKLGIIETVNSVRGDVEYCMFPSVHDLSDGTEADDSRWLLPTAVQLCNTPATVTQCVHFLCWAEGLHYYTCQWCKQTD